METRTDLYEEVLQEYKSGVSLDELAVKYGKTRLTLHAWITQTGIAKDGVRAERLLRQRRKIECWPCGLEKCQWPICYGHGCYLRTRCEAYQVWRQRCSTSM